jgi:hypothetical protein
MFSAGHTGHALFGTPCARTAGCRALGSLTALTEKDGMSQVRVIVAGLYVAAVVLAVTELGRAVAVVVAVVGAAFVLLAFAATGADQLDGGARRITRRRRRA